MKPHVLPAFLAVVLLAGTAGPAARGQEPHPQAAPDSTKEGAYANTPDDLQPFSKFVREPYKRFFLEPLQYTGPGRDKPEPEVDSVVVGVIAPLERSHEAYIGRPMLDGVKLAFAEAQASGGYRGKPFKLVVRNDTGLWGASANEVVRLSYDDKAWAVIGTVDGANTHIAIRVALKTELPVMNVADTDPTLVETRIPWIFRNIADDRQMAYTLAYHVYKKLGFRRVVILRADNRYGRFGVGEFRASSVRLKNPPPMEINYEIAYETKNPNFDLQIERIRKAKPDAIALWADADAGGHLLRQIREAGIDVPVFACDRVLDPKFLELAGEAAEGVVAAVPFDPDPGRPEYRHFRGAYRKMYGEEPTVYAAHGYDGAWMVIDAIRKAGLNRYRIRDALADMTRFKGATGEIMMDRVYSDRGKVTLATVRDGRWVFNEPKTERTF